jgi:ferredoxin/coenzyme F420-reducing hydrogenase delta subunit
LQKPGRWLFERASAALERAFGNRLNPLHYLGALTIFFLWVVLVSGIWLFIFFQTSVDGAYASVERITHDQWYFGGVMRSLHRYASDAAVVTLVLHLLKEWVFDRYRGKHWFSWVTGIPLLWIIIPLGITGYWLVWDKLAQYVALTSAELLDRLPIFTDSMARNFLSATALSDRFFTLMAFLHLIGLPLFLVFAIWLHVFRISGPRINPPRALMTGTLLTMVVLSLLYPALSQGVADLAVAPQSVSLDWYYLLLYPVMKAWSPGGLWLLLASCSALLFVAPWLPPAKAPAIAVVNLDNCNGCERCANDCPFDAINMQPRSDGKNYDQEAVVDPALCMSCGICVGACPTATPFRQATALVPGIELPDLGMAMLRSQIDMAAAGLAGQNRVMAFACASSPSLRPINEAATAVITLRCMAQLPPSFIDYILSRGLADGVFLAGCKGGDCHYRLGAEWTRLRINRERDPYLRKRIDANRVTLGWEDIQQRWPRRMLLRMPWRALAYGLFAVAASVFSAWPVFELIKPGEAVISLTFSHAGQRLEECRQLGQAELDKLPPNMRKPADCPRERRAVAVVFQVDDAVVYRHTAPPSGMWNDGESTIYARFPVPEGEHVLRIGMTDSGRAEGFDYALERRVVLRPEQHVVVEFDGDRKVFVIR